MFDVGLGRKSAKLLILSDTDEMKLSNMPLFGIVVISEISSPESSKFTNGADVDAVVGTITESLMLLN